MTELRDHIMARPRLGVPDKLEPLNMFIRATKRAMCAVMIKKELGLHLPFCYTNKLLSHKESGFSPTCKLMLALASGCRRILPYLYQHLITVVTSSPIELEGGAIS